MNEVSMRGASVTDKVLPPAASSPREMMRIGLELQIPAASNRK